MKTQKEETLYWVESEQGGFDKPPMPYQDACQLAEDYSWDANCIMYVRKDGASQPEIIYYRSYKYVPDINQTTGRRL